MILPDMRNDCVLEKTYRILTEDIKMRTFDRKDVYSVLNAEEARNYINKDGYFANTLSVLNERVHSNRFEILDDVNQLQDFPFISYGKESLFFLPADKVKEVEEKKWRAFKDLDDLKTYASKSVGSVICFPKKIKCFSGGLSGTEKEINQDIDPNIKCVLLFLVDYIEKLEKEISSKNR